MKKLLSVLFSTLHRGVRRGLLLLALFASVSAIYASNTKVDGIWYDFVSSTKTASVTYRGSSYSSYEGEYSGSVTIPETVTYNGTTYSVTSIGNYAFYDCSSLTSVTIPNSVTSIGDEAFYDCSKLTSVTIPNSVTSIGKHAFSSCSKLTSITINSEDIVSKDYSYNSNISHIFGSQVTEYIIGECKGIGEHAFCNCSKLTSVTIGESVTSIGDYAFSECSSLTSVTIPNSVTSIGNSAFSGCYSLPVEDNLRYADTYLVEAVDNTLSTYSIKEGTKWIGDAAFMFRTSLTSVTIPNSVTSIGESAFYDCSKLISVTIGESVTSIGNYAFYDCIFTKDNFINHSTLDAEVNNYWGATIVVGDEINGLFIRNDTVIGCREYVTSVEIPNSVTSIRGYAFYGCKSLTTITIPNSVTSIGEEAFHGCYKLTSVTINSEDIVSKDYSFDSNISDIFGSQVTEYIIGECKGIGEHAFCNCSKLTSVTIGESMTSIGESAFYNCSKLTSVAIPNSVTSIGESAFYNCSKLTSVAIGNSVTSIGSSAFSGCSKLTSVTIPNSVTSIGDYAFDDCTSLTSVTIGNSVTSIGSSTFSGCSFLTSITIPNSVTSIGSRAFEGCSKLTKTNYTGDIAGWCNIKFGNQVANPMCHSHNFYINDQEIKDLVIPNNVTSIGSFAFYGCSSLTSVTIPNSVTSIGWQAFEGCESLTSVTCEAETPPTVGQYTFCDVSTSIPVYVPCGCVEAYKAASGWNNFNNIQDPLAEYSISLIINDSNMGTAKVDKNTACGNQISATANYGYHFVRWSDGNIDNPRSLGLTQDTVLTAEFAPNKYTITTVSSDIQRGTTKGDTTVNYLEYITISATASYGYHFVQWNDGNSINPRQVQVTKDMTYTATFDKNTYAISLSCNEGGRVEGVTSAEYLDTVTISATPNIGYHFVQWSDGVTDNPRTLELTQDTILIAEFAQSFSGQCGDDLYWSYDETSKTISITGSGKMYDFTADTQPWLLFKEQIVEVTTTNTVTSIGTSTFEGCIRLSKISLGTGLEEIAANAFAGCTRLYDIYVYATYPPFAEESSFANYNVYVYVPCEYQRDYTLDIVWGKFKFIECIDSEEATTDGNVTVVPGFNDVTITWPTEGNADTYTIVIKKGNEVFCTLTFNAEGQLLNIAFAPARDGNRPAQYAEQAVNGYRFTVIGLEEATDYTYDITVKDASNKTIKSHSGEFTTQSTTAVDNITTNNANIQKIMRDGQFIIVRDGVEYNAVGQEIGN